MTLETSREREEVPDPSSEQARALTYVRKRRVLSRAIALRLANDGADIAIVDITDKTQAVADEVRALGRKATTFKADVSKRDQVYAAIDNAEKELGGFDVMINNAGIANIQPLADVTPEEVDRIFMPVIVPMVNDFLAARPQER